jgi:stage V sporulation protein AC
MNISQKDYSEMTKKYSPNTKLHKTVPKAFLIGGTICLIGQCFLDLYKYAGFSTENAGILTSVTLALISAVLTGLKVYDKIAKHGGAGTLVPITGFANSVVAPALEFRTEGFITGVGAKMFVIAGPVIVFSVAASVLCGFIYCIVSAMQPLA